MDRRAFVASSVGLVAAGAVSAAEQQPSLRSRLLGAWSLTEAVSITGSDIAPWSGRQTPITGILIYLDSGWMSVQISGARPDTISRADFGKLSTADRFVWLKEYYAYYGTFEIDEAARVVTHRLADSLFPYEKAANLKRSFELEGNILTLLTEPREEAGRSTFNRLVWKKTA
jgi:hypothetical protein